jgi:selenium binding protein SBP56
MEGTHGRRVARMAALALAVVALAPMTLAQDGWRDRDRDGGRDRQQSPDTLYVWTGDQARVAPDFLAVIDFDEGSPQYGQVIRTVPVPGPGSSGNEPHHCHLSADKNILACGGLLALLRGQNSIFFFDVSKPRRPRFMFSTSGTLSNITDDFLPLKNGGFLVTQMGSHTGGTPGRVAEFDRNLQLVGEWPANPPEHDFNPHGISARPELNLMVTSDFMMPASSLNIVPGDPLLRGIVRVWDLQSRSIVRTVVIPTALGTMDVKLIPKDPLGRAFTAGMFDGFVYLVDTANGTAKAVFDCEDIVPHIDVPVRGGMTQLMAMPRSGDRLIFGLFQAGQVGMLDVSDPEHPVQADIVNLGIDAGPHMIALSDDDKRLVVSDYFLNEDDFGKVHFEGDHHVRVIKVSRNRLALDRRFDVDFNTAFATGPARPHGVAMK